MIEYVGQLVAPQPGVDRALDCPEAQQGQHGHHCLRGGWATCGRTTSPGVTPAAASPPARPSGRADQLSPSPEAAVEVEDSPVRMIVGPLPAQRPQIRAIGADHSDGTRIGSVLPPIGHGTLPIR